MKCILFFIGLSLWSFFGIQAQDFRGENRVFVKLETFDDGTLDYESNKFTIEWNEEQNQFTFYVDFDTFKPVDNSASMDTFRSLFDTGPNMTYKSDFPPLKQDAQTDRAQLIDLNGTLWVGNSKNDVPFRIEMEWMDRFLFIDFDLVTTLSKMGVDMDDEIKKKLTGKVHVQVLNGKLTEGFR